MTNLKFKLVFGLFSLLLLWTPTHAQIIDQSLCTQCLTTAKGEFKKCLEAAISQEDKKSCQEKQETHAKTCKNECKIAKAAEDAIIREANPQLIELLSNK
jgi:hypothetical protein